MSKSSEDSGSNTEPDNRQDNSGSQKRGRSVTNRKVPAPNYRAVKKELTEMGAERLPRAI